MQQDVSVATEVYYAYVANLQYNKETDLEKRLSKISDCVRYIFVYVLNLAPYN